MRTLPEPSGLLHAVVFEKAAGRPLTKEDLGESLYYLHGLHLGKLHRLAKDFPLDRFQPRKPWDQERYFTKDIDRYLTAENQEPIRELWKKLRTRLNSARRDKESFGAVHLDLGYSNFFLNGERLELFDFDNCTSGYFASDIALALYGSLFNLLRCDFPGDRSVFTNPKTGLNLEQVWKPFVEGYQTQNLWQEDWSDQLSSWLEAAYLRSVVHAFRWHHPVTAPRVKASLDEDIENLLTGNLPFRFNFRSGKTSA